MFEKSERPVGVPAALAWGMEGTDLKLGSSPYCSGGVGRSTALASSRTTHRIKTLRSFHPLQEPNLTPDHIPKDAGLLELRL